MELQASASPRENSIMVGSSIFPLFAERLEHARAAGQTGASAYAIAVAWSQNDRCSAIQRSQENITIPRDRTVTYWLSALFPLPREAGDGLEGANRCEHT